LYFVELADGRMDLNLELKLKHSETSNLILVEFKIFSEYFGKFAVCL
jgi:hypothetical protein